MARVPPQRHGRGYSLVMLSPAPSPAAPARRIRRLMLATTVLLLACIAIGIAALVEADRRQAWVARSQAVQLKAAEFRSTVLSAGRRVQQDVVAGKTVDASLDAIQQVANLQWQSLRDATYQPEQVVRVEALLPLTESRFDSLRELMRATAAMAGSALGPNLLRGPALSTMAVRLEVALNEFEAAQEVIRAQREAAFDRANLFAGAILIASMAAALALHTLALRMARHEAQRRDAAEQLAAQSAAALQQSVAELDARVAERTSTLDARNFDLGLMHDRLSRVSRQLLQVAEDERRALARELHDDLGQQLAALKINLQLMQRYAHERPLRLDDSVSLVDACLTKVRAQALRLRPAMLDELGLAEALRSHAAQQAARSGLTIDVQVALVLDGATEPWSSAVFRIVQEALNNAITHAGAARVVVELAREGDEVVLRVQDDGMGVAHAKRSVSGGLGLLTMRERTELQRGRFELLVREPRGTVVCCRWPLREVLALQTKPQTLAA